MFLAVRARVTSKGQVTLPVALRTRLDIQTGDDVFFDEGPQGFTLRVVHRKKLSEFRGALAIAGEALPHDEERRIAAEWLAKRHS